MHIHIKQDYSSFIHACPCMFRAANIQQQLLIQLLQPYLCTPYLHTKPIILVKYATNYHMSFN